MGTAHLARHVDEPHALEFEDGFADASGEPDPQLPTTRFATVEQMEQLVSMGMVEGMKLAMGQLDALLAEG